MRALLLEGNDDAMPEGWGGDEAQGDGGGDDDVDMEITFTPGLSAAAKEGEETTLERYQRKMREKRKKRKEQVKEQGEEKEKEASGKKGDRKKEKKVDDEFFEADSEAERPAGEGERSHKDKGKDKGKSKSKKARHADASDEENPAARKEATEEELALLVASNDPDAEPKHFSLKSVIKAEKGKKHRKGRKEKNKEDDGEAQEDFVVNVKDERFKVLFEDHHFAIDPTNPQCVSFSFSA
jgi:hypothetical protein